ncbi:Ger(x)C family spore germination protein [Brevibacillus brevis]|uniref:Ger(X)C family spore germination protein n=1 Tax=Brevibacillus brevis TaxID=1393 RepID=A0ABY9SYG8_BREBE|nr:Ger(x)C family spore germination protein [Brevibacillus brevis]WNC12617.1 Ger(x)C family spore germination protein [Brevibacillus brevis]
MIAKNHVATFLHMLLIAGILLVTYGCANNKDINHRALPIVMGLEKSGGGYKVYLLIPNMNQGTSDVRVVADAGQTINEIWDQISTNMETQVDLLHLKVIVFDRSLAEQGLKDSISSIMRARDISSKTIVAISEEKLGPLFERLQSSSAKSGMEIYNFFEKNAGWTPDVAQTRIWQVFRSLHSYTQDVAISIIKTGKTTTIASTGSAIIKNGKMVGKISTDETLLFNAYNGFSAQGRIEVMDHATVRILGQTLSHSCSAEGNRTALNSNIKLNVVIMETKGNASVEVIKQELEALLASRYQRLFRKLQSKEADILGLGQFCRRQIPRERLVHWRTDYYPKMKLNTHLQAVIQNEGLLKTKK